GHPDALPDPQLLARGERHPDIVCLLALRLDDDERRAGLLVVQSLAPHDAFDGRAARFEDARRRRDRSPERLVHALDDVAALAETFQRLLPALFEPPGRRR